MGCYKDPMSESALPPDAFDLDLSAVPAPRAVDGRIGDFVVLSLDGDRLRMERPWSWGGAVGWGLAAATCVALAAALVPLGPLMATYAVTVILGAPLLWGAFLSARAAVRARAVVLEHVASAGVVRGGGHEAPVGSVAGVALEVVQWRAIRGPGATSRATLGVDVTVGGKAVRLVGPSTEELPLPDWPEARDQLLPLAVALARRLGCGVTLTYRGFAGSPASTRMLPVH